MPKKARTKFEVRLMIERLLNVPYVQGHFFAKVGWRVPLLTC
jgi:hypothetical protein